MRRMTTGRTWGLGPALGLALLLGGCGGGHRTEIFSTNMLNVAKGLQRHVGDKNMQGVLASARAADKMHENKSMTDSEKEVFVRVREYCENDKWDQAKEYIDRCVKASTEAGK